MDLFEAYSKYVHEDIKPADTPTDEELFELEGEKSQVNINKDTSNTENAEMESLKSQIADLTALVNKLVRKGKVMNNGC